MSVVKDNKGNVLKPTLLRAVSADEKGPINLRVIRDDEVVQLGSIPEHERRFIVVWVPEGSTLGKDRLSALLEEFENLKERFAERELHANEMKALTRSLEHDIAAVQDENKTKTEALRQLQKERDPDKLEILVRERTAKLEDDLIKTRAEIATLKGENADLRASKKRLKEANERLREEVKRG
jgi:chromosome segregation ATPase